MEEGAIVPPWHYWSATWSSLDSTDLSGRETQLSALRGHHWEATAQTRVHRAFWKSPPPTVSLTCCISPGLAPISLPLIPTSHIGPNLGQTCLGLGKGHVIWKPIDFMHWLQKRSHRGSNPSSATCNWDVVDRWPHLALPQVPHL